MHGAQGAHERAVPAWVITDGKAGMDVQVTGVADALGLRSEVKHVAPSGPFKLLAPWAPADPRVWRSGLFAPPWPRVAIATGRQSIPFIRALKKRALDETLTIVLQDPKTGPDVADFIWVPAHDRLRGANVFTTLTAPNSFIPSRIGQLRANMPGAIAALKRPRVAVLLGGDNAVYKYTSQDLARLSSSLKSIAALGVSFMITPSRRSGAGMVAAVDAATQGAPRILWDGQGANPYAEFLAHADALIVTADSVNMASEAVTTARPVYVFHGSGGSAKFARFHEGLEKYGAVRRLPETVVRWEAWGYAPLYAAQEIAAAVLARWPSITSAG